MLIVNNLSIFIILLVPCNFLFLSVDLKLSRILNKTLPGIYLLVGFLYLIFAVRPVFYFHHVQPPFLVTSDFLAGYLEDPGGISQWLALLFMQSFHSPLLGPLVFFGLALAIWSLTLKLLKRIHDLPANGLLAMIPFTLSIVLVNNYNFPFSVVISQFFLLLLLLLPAHGKGLVGKLIYFTAGAILTWYISGTGFLLIYSLASLFFLLNRKKPASWLSLLWFPGLAFLIPRVAGDSYFWFFPEKPYFMSYEPSTAFYVYLLSLPFLLLLVSILPRLQKGIKIPSIKLHPAFSLILQSAGLFGLALLCHQLTFHSDAKKIVASDYYCFHNDAEKTARAATTMDNYSFAANMNYNLAISRSGNLSEKFFDFFQISGRDGLFPDVDFSPEMLFIAADFYYDLGYISEARHNAYEALVFYPHSPRAMQLLVKVHLVCGEYKAAERCLRILDKGLVSRRVVEEYMPYVGDPSLVRSNSEFMEKRSFIPAEKELSPYIDERFMDLLEANRENKLAYECLMLYYLLDAQLEPFVELYSEVGNYFKEVPGVYEEAVLTYDLMMLADSSSRHQLSQATLDRFSEFGLLAKQYESDEIKARNVLYWEMGQTYLYYLGYLYPRIVKPEIIKEEYNEAPI